MRCNRKAFVVSIMVRGIPILAEVHCQFVPERKGLVFSMEKTWIIFGEEALAIGLTKDIMEEVLSEAIDEIKAMGLKEEISDPKRCALCGGNGHESSRCPWVLH